MPVLAAFKGRRPNAGTCTENYNTNVFSDVDPSTNVEENDYLSCHENEWINEDNFFNVDSALGLDNGKPLNILGQERNDFWCPLDYILDWCKKICNIHLKDGILEFINLNSFLKHWRFNYTVGRKHFKVHI